jgi:hypothetical protein
MNRSYSYFKSYKVWPALYQISISMPPYVLLAACPQVFSSGGTCTLLPSFLGYIKIVGGAMYPLTLHLGYKKNELHFLHARSCILYSSCHRHWIVPLAQSWRKLFFLSDIGSDRNWGSVCLCVCPTIFL